MIGKYFSSLRVLFCCNSIRKLIRLSVLLHRSVNLLWLSAITLLSAQIFSYKLAIKMSCFPWRTKNWVVWLSINDDRKTIKCQWRGRVEKSWRGIFETFFIISLSVVLTVHDLFQLLSKQERLRGVGKIWYYDSCFFVHKMIIWIFIIETIDSILKRDSLIKKKI
jgi:hypothetical protein